MTHTEIINHVFMQKIGGCTHAPNKCCPYAVGDFCAQSGDGMRYTGHTANCRYEDAGMRKITGMSKLLHPGEHIKGGVPGNFTVRFCTIDGSDTYTARLREAQEKALSGLAKLAKKDNFRLMSMDESDGTQTLTYA